METQSIYNQKLYKRNKLNSKTYFIQTRSYPILRFTIVATSINMPNCSCKALRRGNSFRGTLTDIKYFIHLLIAQEMFCKIHKNRRIVDCVTLINSITINSTNTVADFKESYYFYRNSFEMRYEVTLSLAIRFWGSTTLSRIRIGSWEVFGMVR